MSLNVYTWKSGSKGLGLKTPVKSILIGGNVGHAALEVTWPANDAGDVLARKYQNNDGVVISKRTEIVPEKQENGSYKPKEQVVYFAYFSWWPGNVNGHFNNTAADDKMAEWRHEPEQKIRPGMREVLLSGDQPNIEKTIVTGVLIRDKEVEKIKEISHPTLARSLDNDPAYIQLTTQKQALLAELKVLENKGALHMKELTQAKEEGRPVNNENDLTDAEYARSDEIAKELRVLDVQINACTADFVDRDKTQGRVPDAVVTLPTNDNPQLKYALDTEKMLEEMVKLSRSTTPYSLYKFNCSTAAAQVLKAGITDETKTAMKDDHFSLSKISKSTIATPTSLHHFGKKVQTELVHLHSDASYRAQQTEKVADVVEVKPESFEASATLEQSKNVMQSFKKQLRQDNKENELPNTQSKENDGVSHGRRM